MIIGELEDKPVSRFSRGDCESIKASERDSMRTREYDRLTTSSKFLPDALDNYENS